MGTCNGNTTPSTTSSNCYSTNSSSVTQINCGCTPCDTPVIINQGDVSTQVLVPVLADVIQNCMCINKYETAYPTNLVFQTNLLKAPTAPATAPSGQICITGVTYSYDCVGVGSTASSTTTPATQPSVPTISTYVNSKAMSLAGTAMSCTCTDTATSTTGSTTTTTTTITNIYNQFSGSIKTPSCCCNQVDQAYSLNKIVEKNVPFYACNLKISISGTIGGTAFTANLIGTGTSTTAADVTSLTNGVALSTLGFPSTINFAGRLCLPTDTKLNVNEEFDSCILVDCIRPVTATYSTAADGATTYATFLATGDLSLVITKNIYATMTQKLAVMTNQGAQVVCSDGTASPPCPSFTPCTNSVPCPQPSTTNS